MRICIYGAGAIGGFLGARLALAGVDVSLILRGPHLAATKANGLTLLDAHGTRTVRVTATEDPAELGPQDYVIVTLKAHSAAQVAERMVPLLGPGTAVVTAVNGLPWWYFHGLDGPFGGHRLQTVDPTGAQWDVIGPERAIGCVVYPAAEVIEPGVVKHIENDRFTLGEPNGEKSERVMALAKTMQDAGLKVPVRPRIRDEIWIKLWGNLTFNPISALTGATLDMICGTPDTRELARAMMAEAQLVAEALGIRFPIGIEKRIDGAASVGAHKTSMLQDLERGRPMEIDALVGSVAEVARLVGVATPTIDAILALVRMRGRISGCYPA